MDDIDIGRVKNTSLDKWGNVTGVLSEVPEEELRAETYHAPLGVQSRPRDGKADAIYGIKGDTAEIITMGDVHAVQKLRDKIAEQVRVKLGLLTAPPGAGEVEKGETRLHSVGDSPQAVSVKDEVILIGQAGRQSITIDTSTTTPPTPPKILVGTSAEKGAVRLDDEVDCGTLQITLASAVIAGVPTIGIDIAYLDGLGNTGPFIGLSMPGLLVPPTAVGPHEYKIKGKCVTCSSLVKVE
jgi:hypothetical protein